MDAHEDVLYHRNDGKVSAVGSSRSRPASQTAHHFHHKLAWKAINIDTKHVIFRCDGICKDDPKYNVHTLSDPRNPLTRFRNVESIDLSLPSFVLDNNSVGPQPKREVSIFGLNDNINHAFLSNMCQKTGQIIEIFVYMHPRTKKHLGMAYVVFQDVGKADSFVAKITVLQSWDKQLHVLLIHMVHFHPKEISRRYEEQTIEVAPIPHYLSRLDHNKLIEFRRTNFKNILISLSPSANAQQSTGFKAQESASQKQLDESEAAFNHDNQQMQQSVEPVLTKKVQTENVIPLNEHSTIPLIAENFSPPAASPITNFPCPPLITAQAGHRTSCISSFKFSINLTFRRHFLPLSLLPPVTGRMPFTTWSNVPPPPLRTPAPTILNFVSTAYQTVPSTSSCEETTPMDPAPSEKRRRLRESISVSSGSSSSGNNETNELSEDSSRSSSSTECKYYKKKGLDGTNDYYKTKSDLLQSPELMEEVESYQRIRKYKKQEQESVKQDERFVEPDVDLPDLESVSSEEDQLNVKQCQELKVQSAVGFIAVFEVVAH
ncbi:hypothetical protein DINM_002423 [Dirofilaria immitis]|nr:hypothetical protein [Dirofilaria immitis]